MTVVLPGGKKTDKNVWDRSPFQCSLFD